LKLRVNSCKEIIVNKTKLKKLLEHILKEEKVQAGDIGVIFVDDEYIQDLNRKFLQRDRPTDVLSFPLTEEGSALTEGEIYVSLDRAAEQAQDFKVSFENELFRLVVHGLLHLLGYRDDSPTEERIMSRRVEHYLPKGGRKTLGN
jgi:probable rRNA maturation factor